MSISPITLVQNTQLPNAVAAQYTAPANSKAVVRHVVFTNTDGAGAHTVTAHVVPSGGAVANATMVMDAVSIASKASYVSPELSGVVLNAGDTLQCFADAATSISMNASGILQT